VRDLFAPRRGNVRAVDGVSFSIGRGEFVGYLGPNGAGKSTTVKMLCGILVPTSGEVRVAGFVPWRERRRYVRRIGVVFGQRSQLWWDLAVIESFRLLGKIYGVPKKELARRLDSLAETMGIERLLHTPARKLSLGERMRCDLVASLLHQPEVLFLDEPTIGLDVVAKDAVREFLRHVNRRLGTTILLTTHDLRDVEELCGRVVVIDRGRVLYDGALDRLRRECAAEEAAEFEFRGDAPDDALAVLFEGRGVRIQRLAPHRVRATFDRRNVSSAELVRRVVTRFDVADVQLPGPSIEAIVKRIYVEGKVGA